MHMTKPAKVFIKTYGCQMNVYDSERMSDALAPAGFEETDDMAAADLVVLNTCHIREKAAEKVYSELGRVRTVKEARERDGKKTLVAVAGCVAQAEGAEIVRRAPVVDLVVGPQSYHRLGDLLDGARAGAKPVETEFFAEEKFKGLPAGRESRLRARGVTAFLTVQEGCDKFCTFCVVPYTRGAELSRSVDEIVAEAERLADAGVREVTLLGQNVNAFHGTGPDGTAWGLGRLLHRLADIPGLDRLRYTTSHPRDMDRRTDRRPPGPAGADALSAPAGAVRLRPYPEGHEPAPQGGRLSAPRGADQESAPGYRPFRRLHRRLSRRDRCRFRGHHAADRNGRLRPGLFLQIQPAPGHACRRSGNPGRGSGKGRTARPAASASHRAAEGLQRRL